MGVASWSAKEKPKDAFSTTQWNNSKKTGSQCKACGEAKTVKRQAEFAAQNKRNLDGDIKDSNHWPAGATKADCERYILQVDDTSLPSVCVKTYQAMHCLKGARTWRTKVPKQDHSTLTVQQKLQYLRAAHCKDLSHIGGRDSMVRMLQQEKVTWNLLALDCQFLVDRCDDCRLASSREKIAPALRHLPTPNSAGDCLGWDLKTVTPSKSSKWHMLLCVDFCSHKVWAWDLNSNQISLKHVQNIMLRFMAEHELPAVTWSDNGGQFTGVVTQALFHATGCQSRTIPPGRPQSNGLTEKFNHLMDLTHRGQRDQLLPAVIALNSKHVPALGYSP